MTKVYGAETSVENVLVKSINGGTPPPLQDLLSDTLSTGSIAYLDNSVGITIGTSPNTIDVHAGEGTIRKIASSTADLFYYHWETTLGLSVPVNTNRYIIVDYNAGNPIISATTSFPDEFHTKIYLGEVHNIDGTLIIHNDPRPVGDITNRISSWATDLIGTKVVSGEMVSDSSSPSRYLSVSGGTLYDRFYRKIATPDVNTKISGSFILIHKDTSHATGYNRTYGVTQWPNTQYNVGDTLVALTDTYYSNLWVIRGLLGDVAVMYGTSQYTTQLLAEVETPPATRPEEYLEHGYFIARLTFQKNGASPSSITSFKPTIGTVGGVIGSGSTGSVDHNNLGGLQGGTSSFRGHVSAIPILVTEGGTGAITALDARANLGVAIDTNVLSYGKRSMVESSTTLSDWDNTVLDGKLQIHTPNGRSVLMKFDAGEAFTADPTADTITMSSGEIIQNGTPVRVYNTGGSLPGGLSANTTYYALVVGVTGVPTPVIKLCASNGDRLSNTVIDITSAGSGTNIIYAGWQPISATEGMVLYVNDTSGSDLSSKGYGTGINAYKSLGYALSMLPPVSASPILINVAAGTYYDGISTPSITGYNGKAYITIIGEMSQLATGTASAGSATSLTSTLNRTLNQDQYKLLRITSGTGIGQSRIILSNTAGPNTVYTIEKWVTNPDNTSVFVVEDWATIISGATAAAPTVAVRQTCVNTQPQTTVIIWNSALQYSNAHGISAGNNSTINAINCKVTNGSGSYMGIVANIMCSITAQTCFVSGYSHGFYSQYGSTLSVYDCVSMSNLNFGIISTAGGISIVLRSTFQNNTSHGMVSQSNSYLSCVSGAPSSCKSNGGWGAIASLNSVIENASLNTYSGNTSGTYSPVGVAALGSGCS